MLSNENRLRKDKDIKKVLAKGRSAFGLLIGVRFCKNSLTVPRFAVVIGNKVSKSAVIRNRLKRQVREIIRKHLGELSGGFDVMLMIKKDAIGKKSKEIEPDLMNTLKRKTPIFS